MNRNELTKKIVYVGLFAALTYVCTTLGKIPIPMLNSGYIHVGDTIIVIAACLMGYRYGAIVGGIGSTLADILLAPVWAVPTFIIKVLMGSLIGIGYKKTGAVKYSLYILAGIIMIGGYYVAEALLFGNWVAPSASVSLNTAQYVFSIVVGIIISKKLKQHLNFN